MVLCRLGESIELLEIGRGELAARKLCCQSLQGLANLMKVYQLIAAQAADDAPVIGT